jgi:hypothetical protein
VGKRNRLFVAAVNQFENHFVLLFDNTLPFVTGVALANRTLNAVSIPVNIRNESCNSDSLDYITGENAALLNRR